MRRILPVDDFWPLYGVAASRSLESHALAETAADSGQTRLMVLAGQALAKLSLAVAPFADLTWIAAGPGNNGGDGIEAAIHLHRLGRQVRISLAGDPARLPGDAAASLASAVSAGLVIDAPGQDPPQLAANDLAIDALLGLGSNRAPEGPIATMIGQINQQRCPVLAVDLPTGLDADSGRLLGTAAVRATHTLSLLTLKPGLFTGLGRDYAGVIWLADLATPTPTREPDAWLGGPASGDRSPRRHAQHKGSFGDVAVVAGAAGMRGAALLCARAAHAAGAGRVWVAPLDPDASLVDVQRPELMWVRDMSAFNDGALARMTVVSGCGGSKAVAQTLPRLLECSARIIIDADGLNAIAQQSGLAKALRQRGSRGQPSILTPHPLEAARLLGIGVEQIQRDRLQAARELAERFDSVVVLKGSGSIVAAPGLVPHVNSSGNAALATAGSGDVLAGWLGGSWSASAAGSTMPDQHFAKAAAATGSKSASASLRIAFDATCNAVWWHGAAAEASGLSMLRAGDLIDLMAKRQPA